MLSSGFVVKDANVRRLPAKQQKALKERVILDAVEVTRTRKKEQAVEAVPASVKHMKGVAERIKAELNETKRSLGHDTNTEKESHGKEKGRGGRRKSRHDTGTSDTSKGPSVHAGLTQHPFTKEVFSEEPMTVSEMRAQNKSLQGRFNDLLKAFEALQEDSKMRQESYLRRERRYKNDIGILKEQVEKMVLTRDPDESRLERLRRMNERIQEGMEQMSGQAEALVKMRQQEMEREYRAGLMEMQSSLGESKNRNDALKMELLKTSASLEQKLDWVNEQAMRLNSKNDHLVNANQQLKLEFGSQKEDQSQLVAQLISARKENERLRSLLAERAIGSPSSSVRSLSPPPGQTSKSQGGGDLGASGGGAVNPGVLGGPVKASTHAASLAELRKVKAQLAKERQANKVLRSEHTKHLASRTELENFLRQCIDAVKAQVLRTKRVELAKRFAEGKAFTLEEADQTAMTSGDVAIEEFTAGDRDRVLELLLSKDRVLTLLYGKMFDPRQGQQQQPAGNEPREVGVLDKLVADYETQAEDKLKGVLGPLLGEDYGIYDDTSSSRPSTAAKSRPSSGKII